MRRLVIFVAAVAFGVSAAPVAGASGQHKFSYRGAGTNKVTIQTGEVRELWSGKAKPFGKITTHVTGLIQFPNPPNLVFHGAMVITDPSGDALVGLCSGTGVLPTPDGHEDWTCDAEGGTGKFRRSRGQWKLHIEIHRVSLANGVQKNRFTETGSGRISWAA